MPTYQRSQIQIPYTSNTSFSLDVISKNSGSIIIFIPGQSLPAEMFYGLPIYPDGSSITEHIVNNGFDVAYLDPVGYGKSQGIITTEYSRITIADQIVIAVDLLSAKYRKIFVQGFCATGHAPYMAAVRRPNTINGIISFSPVDKSLKRKERYLEIVKEHEIYGAIRHTSIDDLVNIRLATISDAMLETPIRVSNWETLFLDQLQTFPTFPERGKWYGVNQMRTEQDWFKVVHHTNGWSINDVQCPITIIKGEYDFECSNYAYTSFVNLVSQKLISEKIVKDSTHFGCWEVGYDNITQSLLESLDKLSCFNS